MAHSSYCQRLVGGSSSFITSRVSSFQMRLKHSISSAQSVTSDRPLRQFVSGKTKSAGRNSAGRITIFHRGGGAKRLQRTIDTKRNTSSVGVVERIEYDPNRTSRIAVVRWEEGAKVDHHKKVNIVEEFTPTHKILPTLTTRGKFSLSSLPGMLESRNVVHSAPKGEHVMVGLPKGIIHESKSLFTSKATSVGTQMTSVNDIFLSAFSSTKVKGDSAPYSFVNSMGLPRMAIAGARPDFFVPKTKEDVKNESLSLDEVKKWDKDSDVWAHKMKSKAAVSWRSFRGVVSQNKSDLKLKALEKGKREGKFIVDRAPLTYILATQGMEAGCMVMNYNSSKRSNDELLQRS